MREAVSNPIGGSQKVSEDRKRFQERMALPSGMKGFTSCSGFQFFSKFVPGFLHECEQWLISPAH